MSVSKHDKLWHTFHHTEPFCLRINSLARILSTPASNATVRLSKCL